MSFGVLFSFYEFVSQSLIFSVTDKAIQNYRIVSVLFIF